MSHSSELIINSTPSDPDTLFDKKIFDKQIRCLAVKCPRNKSQIFVSYFKSYAIILPTDFNSFAKRQIFTMKKCKNVPWLIKPPGIPLTTIIVLNPSLKKELLSEDDQKYVSFHDGEFVDHVVCLTFDNWKTDYILKKLLPDEQDITCHFETVGHIAHLNLRDYSTHTKHIIGAVILEKNKVNNIRTVVNKVGVVENQFRTLPMELIAGEPNTFVTIPESTCKFHFDFSTVFWNSRLQGEHNRIIKLCSQSDVICDMFAGVGPFAIPLAKNGCYTYANDLNPSSYMWMLFNAEKNLGKKKRNFLKCYNMDGKEFLKTLIDDASTKKITQIIMNLPKLAPELCSVFVGLFPENYSPLPMVHVYCFSSSDDIADMERQSIKRIEDSMKTTFTFENKPHVQRVRQTSKNTYEFCVSFQIPKCITYNKVCI